MRIGTLCGAVAVGDRMRQLTSLLSLMLVACAAQNPDCLICEAPDDALVERAGRAYLISRLTFSPASDSARPGGDRAAGLDVDGRDSGLGEDGPGGSSASSAAASP